MENSGRVVYKLTELEKGKWDARRTIDDVSISFSDDYQWSFTCRNELCACKYYKEAVDKFNDFTAGLIGSFGSSGDPVWWFRGQSNISWPIQPSALRSDVLQSVCYFLPIIFYDVEYAWKQLYFEKWLMSKFVRDGSSLLSKEIGNTEWYALGQHHGMPTRLLDWSLNPMVALWMAVCDVEQADRDGVIVAMAPYPKKDKMAVCRSWNSQRIDKLINWLTIPPPKFVDSTTRISDIIKNEMDEFGKDEAILTYTPFNYSARQSSQQSVFTLHTPPSSDSKLVANVGVNEFYECHEFVVPAKLKEFYKTFLFVSGMRRWNLFPDLENVARGVRESMVAVPGNKTIIPFS